MAREQAEVKEILARFVNRLKERIPLTAVILYGSYAWGTPHAHSGIDVLVVSPAFGSKKLEDMRLLTEVALETHVDLEALPVNEATFRNRQPGSYLEEAVRTGKFIYPDEEESGAI